MVSPGGGGLNKRHVVGPRGPRRRFGPCLPWFSTPLGRRLRVGPWVYMPISYRTACRYLTGGWGPRALSAHRHVHYSYAKMGNPAEGALLPIPRLGKGLNQSHHHPHYIYIREFWYHTPSIKLQGPGCRTQHQIPQNALKSSRHGFQTPGRTMNQCVPTPSSSHMTTQSRSSFLEFPGLEGPA